MWLNERVGKQRGRTLRVESERLLVGRAEDCDLRIEDANVSRWHAYLARTPEGAVELHDLGSANGTYVDGRRVTNATLTGGEQLQFGDTVLVASVTRPIEQATGVRPGAGESPAANAGASVIRRALREDSVFQRAILGQSALQRSVSRGTRRSVLAGAAVAALTVVAALAVTGVLSPTSTAERAIDRVGPATVLIHGLGDEGTVVETGSGWVLDADAGLVVTNAHVVNAGTRFKVGVDGRLRDARVLSAAPCEDLAVLRIADTRGLRAAELGEQRDVRPGEAVVAVGFPGNASLTGQLTATEGIVSVARTTYEQPGPDVPPYRNVIQTDAAVNPGNSGGPLVDADGRLVGVNSAVRTVSEQGRAIQGQSYAIGVDRAKQVLATLRTGRSIGWAGIGFDYPTAQDLRRARLPAGLFASRAVPGTPARRAGIGEQPLLLVAIDGRPVGSTLSGYCQAVAGVAGAATATLTVLHPDGSGAARKIRLRFSH